jgi:NhaP-type Na+/H+ and K+/H+ antiporter
VDAWLAKVIMRPVVVGDQVALDRAELSVRTMSDGVVKTVGLKLPSPSETAD